MSRAGHSLAESSASRSLIGFDQAIEGLQSSKGPTGKESFLSSLFGIDRIQLLMGVRQTASPFLISWWLGAALKGECEGILMAWQQLHQSEQVRKERKRERNRESTVLYYLISDVTAYRLHH